MSETKPAKMSVREQIESAWTAKINRPVPGLLDILDARDVELSRINDLPFNAAERQRRIDVIEAAAHAKAEKAREAAIRTASVELDQEEGRLRAVLNKGGDPAVAQRATFLMQQVSAASAPVILSLFENAKLGEHDEVVRAIGTVGLQRHEVLIEQARSPMQRQRAQEARNVFSARVDEWTKSHPAPVNRLAQIERERANVASLITMSAAHVVNMYRAGQSVQARPGLRVGPNFDRRAEEHPMTGHEIRR